MRRWIRGLTAAVCLLAVLSAHACLADVAEWARAQSGMSMADQRIANQREALGADVNTSVRAEDITEKCSIRVSSGNTNHLLGGHVSRGWSYSGSDEWIGISLPEGIVPGALRIEWRFDPAGYEIVEYDAERNVLRTRTQADSFPGIYTMFALLPQTRAVRIGMTAPDQVVVNLALYSEGVLPNDVQTWLPPVEKADMMVFSTHQDDEVIFMGGTIPYSDVVCGRPTVTVYMTNCSRPRRREALECLWVMGSRHYPEFINLEDKLVGSMKEGISLWGGRDNILREMVARIRRYKPEVIVTHDFKGEYGHNQHKIVAQAMPYAVQAAADPSLYPDSYESYGAWQVKKLYIHLYKEHEIRMDWLTPQPALNGLTLLKVAQNGMEKHASQTKYFTVKDKGKYDNARFGLYMSTVGEDVAKNDFFENIPRDASAKYLEEHREEIAARAARIRDAGGADGMSGAGEADGAAADEPAAPSGGADDAPEDTSSASDPGPGGQSAEVEAGASAPGANAARPEAKGGGAGAVVLVGAGVALAGLGAWYLTRLGGRRRRAVRRRRAARTLRGRRDRRAR